MVELDRDLQQASMRPKRRQLFAAVSRSAAADLFMHLLRFVQLGSELHAATVVAECRLRRGAAVLTRAPAARPIRSCAV